MRVAHTKIPSNSGLGLSASETAIFGYNAGI